MYRLGIYRNIIVQLTEDGLSWIDKHYDKAPTKKNFTDILRETGDLCDDILTISLTDFIEIFGELDTGYSISTALKSKNIVFKGDNLKLDQEGDLSDPNMISKLFGISMDSHVTVKLTGEGQRYMRKFRNFGVQMEGDLATTSFRNFMQIFQLGMYAGMPWLFQTDEGNQPYIMIPKEAIKEAKIQQERQETTIKMSDSSRKEREGER